MFKTIWSLVLRLFGITKTQATDAEVKRNVSYAEQYEAAGEMNFTAIFAGKLASLAVTDSTVSVVGDNARAEFLDGCLAEVWKNGKRLVCRMLGTGGCALIPVVNGGRLHTALVPQNRIIINKTEGDRMVWATVLADSVKEGDRLYFRWVDYRLEGGTVYITNRVTDNNGLSAVYAPWSDTPDHAIAGVEQLPFAFLVSPVDNRRFHNHYGVPVTYGCDAIIEEIRECMKQITDEFKLKEVRVFADDRMFRRDPKTGKAILPSKLFVAAHGKETGPMIDVFSPEIRESSYYGRLEALFGLLEKAVGTSRGILTAPESSGATATEIRRGMYDTFSLIGDIRMVVQQGLADYLRACDVLANYFDLAPRGEYALQCDWDYSMLESSAEAWAQMKEAQAIGVVGKAEVRQWLRPNETAEEAQAAIDEIRKNEPAVTDLLGE